MIAHRNRFPAPPWLGLALAAAAALPSLALASDGGRAAPDSASSTSATSSATAASATSATSAATPASAATGTTYYESVVGSSSVSELASATPGVPQALRVVDASATVQFTPVGVAVDQRVWELLIDGFTRNHERVDAIYDMVLVLPLPADAEGRDAFQPIGRGVAVEEGPAERSVPLIYGGEKIVLKRNVGLEKTLLPGLIGSGRGATGLPDLAGSGYHWTAWDAIVARDEGYGDTIEARARLRYRTAASASAPDAGDSRLAAYLITWIPALPASIPPFAVRIEVGRQAP